MTNSVAPSTDGGASRVEALGWCLRFQMGTNVWNALFAKTPVPHATAVRLCAPLEGALGFSDSAGSAGGGGM